MVKIAGVRFRGSGKIYWFAPGELPVKAGDPVIVETARGIEYGQVCGAVREVEEEKLTQPLRGILRIAGEEDRLQQQRNLEKDREAMMLCKARIRKHGLDMKLIDAEYTFDNSKVLFYFTADGRIDFRELVKDLAGIFRTRIELRQIGVRDETKILGGIGICGRPLCCHTYLTDFVPVSIKMAKEQNLSLNPAKISGVCGRLMCCLKNEEDTYEYLNSKLPAVGDTVTTVTGAQGQVLSVSVLRQKVRVLIEENDVKEIQEYEAAQLTFRPRRGKGRKETAGKAEHAGRPQQAEHAETQERAHRRHSERRDKAEHADRAEHGGAGRAEKEGYAEHAGRAEREGYAGHTDRAGRRDSAKRDGKTVEGRGAAGRPAVGRAEADPE